MPLLDTLRVVVDNMTRHRLRTVLTMLGIVFGVAAVLSMLSIGAGAEKESLTLIQNMGLRNIIVKAKTFDPKELSAVRRESPGLSQSDVQALQQALAPGSVVAGKRQVKTYQVVSRVGRSDSRVLAVSATYPSAMNLHAVEGAFFLPFDENNLRPVCVLGTTARRKLFGTADPVGELIKINDAWFHVVGVLQDQFTEKEEFEGVKIENSNDDIYIPLRSFLARFEPELLVDELSEVVIQIPENVSLPEQSAVVSSLLGSLHKQIDDFRLVVPEKLLSQNRKTQRIFNIVMGAIASISLLVGGIGIMNIMLASVLERTNEIGLRRALGARKRDISRQFLMEAIGISLIGSLIGTGLGFGISRGVSTYAGWPTVVTLWAVLLGVGVSSAVGIAFGFYPARRAATVSPIESLRHE